MKTAPYKINPSLLEQMKKKLAEMQAAQVQVKTEAPAPAVIELKVPEVPETPAPTTDDEGTDRFGNLIHYNAEQLEAINLGASGKDCIVIGAAGTGKTTVTKAIINKLIDSGKAGVLAGGHKHLPSGTPGIVCVSYTRRAVMNLKKNMSEDMKKNCITIHKLLEYQPIFYEVYDPETGETKTTMKFQETRNQHNPLPPEISTIVIDESSMASVDLFNKVANACSHKVQFIFLGDIQQLPPTFGSAILGFKMLELPTVELTTVYRQALESPIIRLAHRILSGNGIPHTELDSWTFEGQLKFNAWKKKLAPEAACIVFGNFITKAYDLERYDPEQDMILCPFNVNFGTDELNKIVAQHLAKKYNRQVHEVIAGFNKKYFSVGEKVLYEREDAEIIRITLNPGYSGTRPQLASTTLSYWGLDSEAHKSTSDEDDVDFLLHQMSAPKDVEERVNVASHTITVRLLNSEEEVSLQTASEINSLLLGYALTVHKSQGSEWRRVFLALHQSHATMCSRELLYTAVTRAKEELYIVCEKETFVNGIKSQRIKGNTLAEKAEFFKGKKEETKILA